jgi:predicted DNA-binding transcriptional regulator AlpA
MRVDNDFLTTKQVAEMLGVGMTWMWERRQQFATGPDFFKIGKKIWYRKQDVERWREGQRNGGSMPS